MALDQLGYLWAVNHNVALASLTNVARDLKSYNLNHLVPPVAQPVDIFPIRVITLNGKEHGEGNLSLVWSFGIMTPEALDYICDTFLTTGGNPVTSKAVTIYTPRHDRLAFQRYNAYMVYPQPPNGVRGTSGDYRFERGFIRDLNLRFLSLEAL